MKKNIISSLIYIVSALVVLALCFVWHGMVHFMMDDLWYSTNLATGEPLSSVKDVFSGQVWHYYNWGGRSVTHTLLQFVLMSGEHCADVLNIIAAAVLSFVCTRFVKKENRLFSFCLIITLMISLNPGLFYSMFWQSGAVNYLYSSSWILFFAYVFIREIEGAENDFPGVVIWMPLLGLITGWSNENMGPASFCLAVMTTGYEWIKQKKKPKPWMIEGIVSTLVGSAICILAPGNFVRSEFTGEGTLTEMIKDRFMSMLTAGASFLLPSVVLLIFFTVLTVKFLKIKLSAGELILAATAVLAYGAMILSPHFPDRAAFGIMIFNIVLIVKQLEKICDIYGKYKKYVDLFYLGSFVYCVAIICANIMSYGGAGT